MRVLWILSLASVHFDLICDYPKGGVHLKLILLLLHLGVSILTFPSAFPRRLRAVVLLCASR